MPGNSAAQPETTISYGPPGLKGLLGDPIVLAFSAFASIGGVPFGYDQGFISGVLVTDSFAKQFLHPADDATLQGWMVSVLALLAVFGALLNGVVADRLSRRWSILLATVFFDIGSAIQAGAVNEAMIFLGRAIAGIAIGMLSMVVPLYITELAPPSLRGGLVALQQLAITFGIMIAFWIDYGAAHIRGTGGEQSPAARRLPVALQLIPALGKENPTTGNFPTHGLDFICRRHVILHPTGTDGSYWAYSLFRLPFYGFLRPW